MSTTLVSPKLPNVVEIDWYDGTEGISVNPRDQLRFTIQKDVAIEVLRLAKASERFMLQFELLLGKLGAWVSAHRGSIRMALVTLQDASLMFLVIQCEEQYDGQLQDDLAEVDFAIAQDVGLDLIRLRTMMLPPVDQDSLSSFVDARMVMQYQQHGN